MEDWQWAWIKDMVEPASTTDSTPLTTTYTDDTLYPMHKEYMTTPLCRMPANFLLNQAARNGGIPNELRKYIMLNFSRLLEREAYEFEHPPVLPKKQQVHAKIKERVEFICDKRTYATEKLARERLKKIRDVEQEEKKPIRVYECPLCSGWHLTSMPIEIYKKSTKITTHA